jgi:hypothetical protein
VLRDQLLTEYENRFALKRDYVSALKFDPSQPRDDKGRWTNIKHRMATLKIKYPAVAQNYPRSTHTEMGSIEAHTKDVGREWEKQLTDEEMAGISERFGSDVEKLMETAIPLHDIGKAEAIESGAGKEAQHQFTVPIMQDVLRKEGFSDKDITLATELLNHDLIGPLFRGYEGFSALEADVVKKLQEKATRVGMDVADFTTLQMAFYQADASAYPYITSFMTQEPSGKWTFKGNPKITAIEKLMARKFDPSQPRDDQGQWTKTTGRSFSSEEGYQWHEKGPGAEWAKTKLTSKDADVVDSYAGFTYRQINELRRGKAPTKEARIRALTPEEHQRIKDADDGEAVQRMIPPEGPEFRYSYSYDNIPKDTPGGPGYMAAHWAVKGPVLDEERLTEITDKANHLDDLIANRGLVLDEPVQVIRGAYLPGVTFESLQAMQYEGPNGEPPPVYEEKGFTSTMLGEAGGRAKSYPALGKWESLYQRYGSKPGMIAKHQDEVGTAVQFHITLPAGTKVAAVEAARRMRYEFPRVQDPAVFEHPEWTADGKLKVEDFTIPDYTQTPTINAKDLDDKDRRTESEILLGSGARFRVTKVHPGYTYQTGDPTLKPVQVAQVYLEYIGGGSSEGKR